MAEPLTLEKRCYSLQRFWEDCARRIEAAGGDRSATDCIRMCAAELEAVVHSHKNSLDETVTESIRRAKYELGSSS